MQGKVWLVGAGPSDVGLLTIKGKYVLTQADVVVYDQLVDLSILLLIPETAEAIDAGKHAGNHTLTQEEINEVIVNKALEGKKVVRLKGGDPFVFGRGGEEIEALIQAKIEFEVVPGITSSIAVPAYVGIPVTHRDYTPSFHVITAHRKRGQEESIDYSMLVGLGNVTLVFLMGVKALPQICKGLIDAGAEKRRPAAIIQNGTRYNQKSVISTLEYLPKKAEEEQIQTPGIIIVGKVCELAARFTWREYLPLGKSRVIVTRAKEKQSNFSEQLRNLGAEVLELPMTKICKSYERSNLLQRQIDSYQWLVFTSEYAVECFFKLLKDITIDYRKLSRVKMAVIGEKTKLALQNQGFFADYMPKEHYGEQLAQGIIKLLKPKDEVLVLMPSNVESPCYQVLKKASENKQFTCDGLGIYQVEMQYPRFFDWEEDDIVTFASATAVEGFARNLREEELNKVRAVCIGKHTHAMAKQYGMQAVAAKDTTMESMVEQIILEEKRRN